MIRIYKYLVVVFFCLWPVMAMGQEADFEIRNFRERTTDLSAISSNYKDLNGSPAALIRMTVRDPQFEFSANLGIIALEKKTGEVYLYVPQDTKRLTVRHPSLGVLKDYAIPVRIRSKVTYDADIAITGSSQPIVPNIKEPVVSPTYEPVTPTYPYEPQPQPKSSQNYSSPEFHFYAGIGFNAVSLMGPSVLLGISYGMFCLEGGFVYGMDKVENIRFTLHGSSTPTEAYDYSCSKVWARLGVYFDIEKFRISPQTGATFNMISGKAASGVSNSTDYFKEANPMSIFAAVRLSYEVAEHLYVHITPQYDFSLGGDQIYEVIKKGNSKIESWGEGFGINAGIIYEF
jgi:hypothetical protein